MVEKSFLKVVHFLLELDNKVMGMAMGAILGILNVDGIYEPKVLNLINFGQRSYIF